MLVSWTLSPQYPTNGELGFSKKIIAVLFSMRLGKWHFLFICDLVWAVCFAGQLAILLLLT